MSQWQPIESAPKDGTEIVLLTRGGDVVRAAWQDLDSDVTTWIATREDEHPKSWDDGVCWESNSDEEPSDPPTHWIALPDGVERYEDVDSL